MSRKWNSIPWNEQTPPEEKAKEFDLQYEENAREAEGKRQRREYPYDLDLTNRRTK